MSFTLPLWIRGRVRELYGCSGLSSPGPAGAKERGAAEPAGASRDPRERAGFQAKGGAGRLRLRVCHQG